MDFPFHFRHAGLDPTSIFLPSIRKDGPRIKSGVAKEYAAG